MAQRLLDFDDIVDRIREELQIQDTDTTNINRIRREVNIVYEHEVVPFKRWKWLEGHGDIVHKAYYSGGTCTVTPDSATVTLSTAPGASQGSFKGFLFSVDGFDEIYEISAHTSQSTTVTLASTYQGASASSTATFKIWRDTFNVPTDCRETFEIWHNRHQKVMTGIGRQEMRSTVNVGPKVEGFPQYYTLLDYHDPSPNDSETESDRYRQVRIHPSLNNQNVTIHFDYIKEVSAMEADAGDEPVIPREDRIVLVYGALAKLWDSIRRNPEMAAKNQALFDRKLSQMAGRVEDSFDTPKIQPNLRYVRAQRGRLGRSAFKESFGTGSSLGNITFLQDVTIEGATITGNVTVAAGITIDGRDLSADGTVLDTLEALVAGIDTANRVVITDGSTLLDESAITSTELTYLDDVTVLTSATLTDNSSGTIVSWAFASFDVIALDYSIKRGTAYEAGVIRIITDGSNAAIAQGAIANIGSNGVTLTVSVSGSNVNLNYSTTSTGDNATFKYKAHKWLS